MPTKRPPALLTDPPLAELLLGELLYIRRNGLSPSPDSESIPVLAELAEVLGLSNDDDPDSCGLRVEQLLLDALKRLRRFDRFSRSQLRAGLAELLGIGEQSWKTANERFDNAAIELGYSSGESLRQTRRKNAGPIWEECLAQLARQLLLVANEAGFTYRATFAPAVIGRQTTPSARRTGSSRGETDVMALALIFLAEVRTVFTQGVERSVAGGLVPTIALLADVGFPGNDNLQRVEAMLRWAINDHEPDEMRREGIAELLELGKVRGLKLGPRRDRAAPFFGYKAGFTFHWGGPDDPGGVELPILLRLRDLLVDLALCEGVTTTD